MATQWALIRNEIAIKSRDWSTVIDLEFVRDEAERLLLDHGLRTGDALQLAAAILIADGRNPELEFVTFDRRLGEAAAREGFPVLGV